MDEVTSPLLIAGVCRKRAHIGYLVGLLYNFTGVR